MSAPLRKRAAVALLSVMAAVGGSAFLGGDVLVLLAQFGPALALLAPLALGRYPGEKLIVRRHATKRAPCRASAPVRLRPRLSRVPRGTALLAHHWAVRPPPVTSGA